MSWTNDAACKGVDPNLFFPTRGSNSLNGVAKAAIKQYCNECPVRLQCLDYALVNNEPGIWGGTSQFQRRRMKSLRLRTTA